MRVSHVKCCRTALNSSFDRSPMTVPLTRPDIRPRAAHAAEVQAGAASVADALALTERVRCYADLGRPPLIAQDMDLNTCHAAPPHQLTSGRPKKLAAPSSLCTRGSRSRKNGTHLPGGTFALRTVGHASVPEIEGRSSPRTQTLRTAPVGITPVSRYRQSATTSLRATATIVIFRIRPYNVPTRWRYHCEGALSG
jgi:hypothetical protein